MQFIKDNILCIFLVMLGLLAWFVTIGARIESRKTGRFVSGVPGIGGILIIIGFLIDMWYFFVKVVPDMIRAEKAEKNYIPPEDLEGGKVLEYSLHNKEYEEITIEREYPYADELHSINRYVIIQRDGKYILLKTEHNIRVIERIECGTSEECKEHASSKAKWIKL